MSAPAAAPGRGLLLVVGALAAFAPLSIDMYLPAFPAIERAFDSDPGAAQTTLAAFFLGFALGQTFYGAVTDAFGRKAPLYFGLAVYVLASLGCAFAPSVAALAGLRFLQALGACAGMVISRAIVRDAFPASEAPRIYGTLMLVTGAAPILAPLLGGYVLAWFGWQAIFWTLGAFGLACLLAIRLRLPETLSPAARRQLAVAPAVAAISGCSATPAFSATRCRAAWRWAECSPTSPARLSSSSSSSASRRNATAGCSDPTPSAWCSRRR